MALHPDFLTKPLAHRGLHDLAKGIPENSPAAFQAAIDAGYGIELDLQLSADAQAMVFHDDLLDRLTDETGEVRVKTADKLGSFRLKGGQDMIPTLAQILAQVDGQVPLLIEIKDQDGALGNDVGTLEVATARLLANYTGPVAVMSFNPHAMAVVRENAPDLAVGLVTCDFAADEGWASLPPERLAELTNIVDYERLGACFISHDRSDLNRPRVAELKTTGAAILCWTVRSAEEEAAARQIADNITFEGYLA